MIDPLERARSPLTRSPARLPPTCRSPLVTALMRGKRKGRDCRLRERLAGSPSAVSWGLTRPRLPTPLILPFGPTAALNSWRISFSKSNSMVACRFVTLWPTRSSAPFCSRRKPLAIGRCRLPRTSSCRSALPSCQSTAGWARRLRKIRPSSLLLRRSSTPSAAGSRGRRPARSMPLSAPAARRARSTSIVSPSRLMVPRWRLMSVSPKPAPARARSRSSARCSPRR